LKLFLTDLCAASVSTFLMFGLGYAFASKVEEGFQEAKHYLTPAVALGVGGWLLHRYIKARIRAGRLVGPPVLVDRDDIPLPPDDLHPKPVKPSRDSLAEILPPPAGPGGADPDLAPRVAIVPESAAVPESSLSPESRP